MNDVWQVIKGIIGYLLRGKSEGLETTPWMQIWAEKCETIGIYLGFLFLIFLMMVFKDRLAKGRRTLNMVYYAAIVFSFLYVGLLIKAQPTTTNIVILLNGIREGSFPLSLYILEPYIFLTFLFIFLTVIVWGRGVFCGWLCPYGAMVELLNKLYVRVFPKFRLSLPEKVHRKFIYLKYVIFAVILGASFYSFMLSEYLAEVEPFKTFVLKLNRQWYFVLYFMVVTAGSLVIYRAYCRYICPLGAALSIPSFIKLIPLIKLKRHDLCGTCRICEKECNYNAIMSNGKIDANECLDCLICQVNFWDEDRCPALIKKKRQKEKVSIAYCLLPVAFILLLTPSQTYARTLIVGSDYPTINDALKKARDGDVIEVKGGHYTETVRIDKPIHLKGINNPVLEREGGNIIEITRSRVTVEGLTLIHGNSVRDTQSTGIYISKGSDNVTVRNNQLNNIMFGIWAVSNRGVRIEGNVIEGRKELDRNYRGNCIYLTDAQEATVKGNRLSFCRDGMYVEASHDGRFTGNEISDSRYALHTMWVDRGLFNNNFARGNLVGLAIMYTKQSEIKDNISVGNQTHGLLLIQTVRSEVRDNTVIGNTKGIFLYNSILNRVISNLVMNNNIGIHSWGGSEENSVNRNSFISNEVQVKFVAGRNQRWDGNYWSDYIGWDMTGDGIGDLPYESNTVVDHIFWRYPSAKLLYASASFQFLWMLEKQFPLLKVPRVIDSRPSMLPLHRDWKELLARYPYKPERYYGEAEKLPVH
ncbi:MAG: hypothetical protein OHK0032_05610 [Thermodesulfovibrionales bacterium]